MSTDPAEKLRELALSVTRGDLRRPWSVQTSNSFRRIGTDRGDGDVLCAVTQRHDKQPDLHAAPAVLDYIVAAHPLVILQLIRERDTARYALYLLRHKITGHSRIFREAGGMAGIPLAGPTTGADQSLTDRAAAIIQEVIADLMDRCGLRQAWEEIEDGIRQEIIESWEDIVRNQISEAIDDSEGRGTESAEGSGDGGRAGEPEQWAEDYAVEKLGDGALRAARDVVRDAFLAGYLVRVLESPGLRPPDSQIPGPSQVLLPEVLRGFRALACALTAPQTEHPDVRAACAWLAADSSSIVETAETAGLDSPPTGGPAALDSPPFLTPEQRAILAPVFQIDAGELQRRVINGDEDDHLAEMIDALDAFFVVCRAKLGHDQVPIVIWETYTMIKQRRALVERGSHG